MAHDIERGIGGTFRLAEDDELFMFGATDLSAFSSSDDSICFLLLFFFLVSSGVSSMLDAESLRSRLWLPLLSLDDDDDFDIEFVSLF